MTAVITQVAATSGGGGGSGPARNVAGSVVGLAPGATDTLVDVVAGTRSLRGFNVHGTTDAFVWVEENGVPMPGVAARFNRALMAYLVLPNPMAYASGLFHITLRVRNEGPAAGDYEGILLGE